MQSNSYIDLVHCLENALIPGGLTTAYMYDINTETGFAILMRSTPALGFRILNNTSETRYVWFVGVNIDGNEAVEVNSISGGKISLNKCPLQVYHSAISPNDGWASVGFGGIIGSIGTLGILIWQ